jgi:uncharacterized pyridoxal phosphate-containing UPF0001 family protein
MNGDIQTRFAQVRKRVAETCARAGRNVSDVKIVAVTKTFGPEDVSEVARCGLRKPNRRFHYVRTILSGT